MESPLSKVTEEVSTFRKLFSVDWFLPKSSAFRFVGSQVTGYDAI